MQSALDQACCYGGRWALTRVVKAEELLQLQYWARHLAAIAAEGISTKAYARRERWRWGRCTVGGGG